MTGPRRMTVQVLDVTFQLALLMASVAVHFYVLAVIAAVLFLWRGSTLVYRLVSRTDAAPAGLGVNRRLESLALSDGSWAVATGIGAVLIVSGWLLAVIGLGHTGHYVGVALLWVAASTLGRMRRIRQDARAVE
ncbi:MAG: hypothetical protein QOI82_2876 [Actinomycetota bacterium]|nr:hypothetical protein [Actinomycetota bacterium]